VLCASFVALGFQQVTEPTTNRVKITGYSYSRLCIFVSFAITRDEWRSDYFCTITITRPIHSSDFKKCMCSCSNGFWRSRGSPFPWIFATVLLGSKRRSNYVYVIPSYVKRFLKKSVSHFLASHMKFMCPRAQKVHLCTIFGGKAHRRFRGFFSHYSGRSDAANMVVQCHDVFPR
jgi:hypothetical protein